MTASDREPVTEQLQDEPSCVTSVGPGDDPVTESGRRLVNDTREVVVHGLTDRIPGGYGLAWHVQRTILAIEAEAAARESARAEAAEEDARRLAEALRSYRARLLDPEAAVRDTALAWDDVEDALRAHDERTR